MTVKVQLRYLRIAPRKVRLIVDIIRGKGIAEARTQLQFLSKKATNPLLKLLNSAAATAQQDHKLSEENLYISKVFVDEGPKLKRWRPRARGRAYQIQKKTSHITLVLSEIKKGKKTRRKKRKPEEEGMGEAKEEKKEKVREEAPSKEKKIFAPKQKAKREKETRKPASDKGIRRIFRRKAF